MRNTAVRWLAAPTIVALLQLWPLLGGVPDANAQTADDLMRDLRKKGWALLAPFIRDSKQLQGSDHWRPRNHFLPTIDGGAISGAPAASLQQADEQLSIFEDYPPKFNDQRLPVFEMTLFNDVAREFIVTNGLNSWEASHYLLGNNVREVQFPSGSIAVKSFWHVVKKGQQIDVRKWSWSAAANNRYRVEPRHWNRLAKECVAKQPGSTSGCVTAAAAFHTVEVSDPSQYHCEQNCVVLEEGDLLILVGLHIASKEMPEWLWATFWWRYDAAPSGDFWTCGDAQRTEVLGNVPTPWSYYSMDVVASFTVEKPRPKGNNPCGFPGSIKGEELLSAYNPFVEAQERNGLRSSCVDCHSRASTDSDKPSDTLTDGTLRGPTAVELEGHVRLDYVWSLWRGLHPTTWPKTIYP
jgi:hypothetical protein